MKYLGIDYGSKRVGVAISDEALIFSFPLTVLDASDGLVAELKKICDENSVEVIVVGESRDFSFQENNIMKEVHPFINELKEATGLPVYLHPEFMTSQEAERIQGKNDMHDASAAALILKSYLDTKNNGR